VGGWYVWGWLPWLTLAAADLAAKDGGEIGAVELMREVSRYNEIDCRVMAEVLDDLRRNH